MYGREAKRRKTFIKQSGRMRALSLLKRAHPDEYELYLFEGMGEAERIYDSLVEITEAVKRGEL